MSELKRQMADVQDSLSFMSPFHKELKLENGQHPGQQYFYQLNNNPDMMIRQNFLQQQQQQSQQSFQNRQQQQQQQQYSQQQQQGYVINPQFYGVPQSSSQSASVSFPSSQQSMQNGFAQPNQFGFPQQVLTAQYIPNNSASQQQLPQIGISFLQPMQTQSSQQQQISQQQQQLPIQRQQQISQQSVPQLSQSPQANNNANGISCNNNNNINNNAINNVKNNFTITNSGSDTSRKSGEKALNNFQEFIQMTQHIGQADLNLEFVKDMYTFKMDTLPSSKEMLDNFQRILSKQGYSKQQKKNWNDSETNLLVWIILKSCVLKRVDFRAVSDELWKDISTMMVGRTEEQCKLKWLSMSKLNLQQQPWSEEEDKALIKIIKEYEAKNKSNKWSEIAVKLNQLSHKNVFRQGKQCRERWNNHLDPAINRGPWSQEEEVKMLRLVLEKGKRWSEISKSMASSRTENSVKNRFNSLLKKEKGIACNAAETQSNQQDLTDYERIQVTLVIEKMEARIKNGFSLVKNIREGQIEEEEENENELESRSQLNTGQQGNNNNNNNSNNNNNNNNNHNDEGDDDEDDEEEDDQGNYNQEEQSISMQSCVIKAEEPLSQNNIISRTASNTQSVQQQAFDGQSQISLLQTQQQQQQGQQSQQYQQPPLRANKPLLNKNVVQSKNALFQMVEIEAKIKSEQSIHSEQNIAINQGNQIQATPVSSASSGLQTIAQELPIMSQASEPPSATIQAISQRDDQCNSQNNSPSLFNLGKAQQASQPWNRGAGGGSKRMSFMESNVNLPSTPLLSCFRHLETKQSQSLPTEINVKRYSKRSLKREEFEEELARSQLVLMDKSTKEIFVVTPQFIQSKITQDFQRNVAVLNSFMFANQVDPQTQQSSTNLPNQNTFNTNTSLATTSTTATPSSSAPNFNSINSAFTPANQSTQNNTVNLNPSSANNPTNTNNLPFTAKDSSTLTLFNSSLMNTPNINTTNTSNNPVSFGSMQNGQGSTTSISMFLNSPPLGPSSMTQLNSNHVPRAAGELTPGLFSYQGGQFNMSTQNLNAGTAYNSPGMFFLQYSNANTPSQQLITQITPQPSTFSPQQQRMINQMPMATMLHANSNLSNAATASWSSQNSSSSPQTQTCRYTNSNNNNNNSGNSVIQTAAMLNKQLINQDVCQQLAKQ